ncbi:electron transporter RnfB [Candidatus Aerophobetes bacterium]|uniref:Ion-translocating oxidoreductase complex subunit B n=1 Tax=Aerophobetes bacterium TaxID=2030807 RepID=A0A662DJJ1_UNCAE|nr:MAG: electron transporter RnfB [Candidatus Aerophobetes bacterium]
MSLILLAVTSMGALAAFFAVMLSVAHSRLKVEEDPRIEKLFEELPGANCGACGFASCRALAEAIVKGEATTTSCVVGGSEVAAKISQLMGVEAEAVERKLAFVRCGAGVSERAKKAIYRGVETCRAANLVMGADVACSYGCLGFGDCQRICPFDAIKMVDFLPHIDLSRCTGCGRCVEVCPRGIIVLENLEDINYRVKCSSLDKGKKARQVCEKSCIACGRCAKFCPYEACWMEDNLAHIDPVNCQVCGVCYTVCPTGAIVEVKS